MKQKDMIYAIVAVIILVVAGYLAYTQLVPRKTAAKSAASVSVDKVATISENLNEDAQKNLYEPTLSRNYTVEFDLTTGLGTVAPFGR
jgi:Flp pilus assembly protein CpaB